VGSVAIVWFVIALLTLSITAAMLVALVRHVFVLGRAVSRFGEEISPIAREIGDLTGRASATSGRMSSRQRDRSPAGPTVR
jgi:hypothetical protein